MGHPWALHDLCMGACVLIRNSIVSELHLGRNGQCGFFIVVSGFVWFILFGQAATFPLCLVCKPGGNRMVFRRGTPRLYKPLCYLSVFPLLLPSGNRNHANRAFAQKSFRMQIYYKKTPLSIANVKKKLTFVKIRKKIQKGWQILPP